MKLDVYNRSDLELFVIFLLKLQSELIFAACGEVIRVSRDDSIDRITELEPSELISIAGRAITAIKSYGIQFDLTFQVFCTMSERDLADFQINVMNVKYDSEFMDRMKDGLVNYYKEEGEDDDSKSS